MLLPRSLVLTIALVVPWAAAPAQESLGGLANGLRAGAALCHNLTTGQQVSGETVDDAWDCGALGLAVAPGDVVRTGVEGTVPEGLASCDPSVVAESDPPAAAGSLSLEGDVPPFDVTEAILLPGDGEAEDAFGSKVAFDGETVIVGSPQVDDPVDAGAVYVFARLEEGWSEIQVLVPEDGAAGDQFGSATAFDSDTILVGAQRHGASGAAYSYVRDGGKWSFEDKLEVAGLEDGAQLGGDVAILGDIALVGASLADFGPEFSAGAVYFFERLGPGEWSEDLQEVTPMGRERQAFFGSEIVLSEDGLVAVISAPFEDVGGVVDAGAAYVFAFDGSTHRWTEEQRLVADTPELAAAFGVSLGILGDRIVVGEPRRDAADPDSGVDFAGMVHVFERDGPGSGWMLADRLLPCGEPQSRKFGMSLALTPAGLLVGAPTEADLGGNSSAGGVYLLAPFVATTTAGWIQQGKVLAPVPRAWWDFGISVALAGETAVAGWPGYGVDDGADGPGSAVVLDLARLAVGGSVAGMTPTRFLCHNVTMGQKVAGNLGAPSWDCQASGLVVSPGDQVRMVVEGTI